MSTKTMKQRIAVVAVSALTAGLFSVIAAPVANAYGDITYATAGNVPAVGSMQVGTTPTTSGTPSLDGGTAANIGKDSAMKSLGWIAKTSTAGTLLGTTALQMGDTANGATPAGSDESVTGVVAVGAKLAVVATGITAAGNGVSLVASGSGKLSGVVGYTNGAAGTTALNGTSTVAWMDSAATQSNLGAIWEISGAAGSTATISAYTGAAVDGTSSATAGTLIATLTVTVAAANAAGSYSAGDSTINVQTPMAKGGTASGSSAFDYARPASNGQVHVVYVALKDAYGSAIGTASMTALTAAVTNSATVNAVDTAGAADSYSATSSFDTIANIGTDGIGYVVVNQPVANTAGSSVLTLTLDGSVIATKTLSWNGDIASLTVVEASSSKTFLNPSTVALAGGASTASPAVAIKNIVYVAKDAAGNILELASHPAISDESGSMVGASLSVADAGTAATDDSQLQTMSVGYGLATMLVPSSALRGAGEYKIKITNAAGATIKSQAVKTTVSTGVSTFTASWDKATYAPGEIATLTITGLDSGSRPVGTGVALGTTALVTTNTDGLASVTASCDAANIVTATSAYYTDGVKTCKFAVKNTEGSYAYTVVVTNSSSQAAIAGTIAVKSASTVVSNADVLKSIVALIASINKQIQALQKLILARR